MQRAYEHCISDPTLEKLLYPEGSNQKIKRRKNDKIFTQSSDSPVVFVLGVAGSPFLLNSETTDDRSDMNDPVLPEVMVDFDGNYGNRMYGYASPCSLILSRDSVTPLDTSKKLFLAVNPYDTKVKSLSYEIRTSDGSKVLENRKIKSLEKLDSYLDRNKDQQ